MLPVSFGAMLMESMLAIIALIAVASFGQGEAAAQGLTTQPQIFAGAIANFLSVSGFFICPWNLPHVISITHSFSDFNPNSMPPEKKVAAKKTPERRMPPESLSCYIVYCQNQPTARISLHWVTGLIRSCARNCRTLTASPTVTSPSLLTSA